MDKPRIATIGLSMVYPKNLLAYSWLIQISDKNHWLIHGFAKIAQRWHYLAEDY